MIGSKNRLVLWPRHQNASPHVLSGELRKINSAIALLRVSTRLFLEFNFEFKKFSKQKTSFKEVFCPFFCSGCYSRLYRFSLISL